jgi:ribonuclease I
MPGGEEMKGNHIVLSTIFFALLMSVLLFASPARAAPAQPWTYVLSWSPQYCQQNPAAREPQCDDINYFIPRALTPESFFSMGSCEPVQPLTDEQVSHLMPIVGNRKEENARWRAEGGCVDVSFESYMAKFDYASRRVRIPEAFQQAEDRQYFDTTEIRQQFVDLNPDMPMLGLALHCVGNELSEVSICLNGNMTFRECLQIQDDCSGRIMVRGARLGRFKRR